MSKDSERYWKVVLFKNGGASIYRIDSLEIGRHLADGYHVRWLESRTYVVRSWTVFGALRAALEKRKHRQDD